MVVEDLTVSFTHEHVDHTAGLDDIRPFFFLQGVSIYGSSRVINNYNRFDYIFNNENKHPGAPNVRVNTI